MSSSARSRSPPSPSHAFWHLKFLQNPSRAPNCYHGISLNASSINSRHFISVRRSGDVVRARKTASRKRGLERFVVSKNMCRGWREARARAGWRVWDLGNGHIMLRKATWEKTLQKTPKFSDFRKHSCKQIRPSCRNIFRLRFMLVWFRGRKETWRFEWIFGLCSKCLGKELPPLSNFTQNQKIFL